MAAIGACTPHTTAHLCAAPGQGKALHDAIKEGNLPRVKEILEIKGIANTPHEDLMPLHLAARAGDPKIVAALLAAGANANFFNGNCSALHEALSSYWKSLQDSDLDTTLNSDSLKEIITLLLEAGADVNKNDISGNSPLLSVVASEAPKEILQLLIDAGAKLDATDLYGNAILHYALTHRRHLVGDYNDEILCLLNAGADIHMSSGSGISPLEMAVTRYNSEMVVEFVMRGARVSDKIRSDAKQRRMGKLLEETLERRKLRFSILCFREANDRAPDDKRLHFNIYKQDAATSGSASSATPPSNPDFSQI